MTVPTLVQLRDQLGRALIDQPNSPVLHSANRVLNLVFERRAQLPSKVKLAAGRAVALALDLALTPTLSAGVATPLLSDSLDPRKQPTLSWATHAGDLYGRPAGSYDPLLDLANSLDKAQEALRTGASEAPLDVANALDRAYTAVAESAKNVGRGAANAVREAGMAALMPVGLAIGAMLAFGYARRGGRRA